MGNIKRGLGRLKKDWVKLGKTMNYKEITIFELDKRIKFLIESREDTVNYFSQLSYDLMDHPAENKSASELRQKINYNLSKIEKFISATGTRTSIFYSPPPAIGGIQGNIDLFANIFNLDKFDISPKWITDCFEKSIGIYNNERKSAIIRTFNPFWWLWKLIKVIIGIPFFILNEAGFDSGRFENSILGKIIKLALEVAVGVAIAYIVFKFGWNK